ncbi:MAG: hypothetical protein KAQ92_08660, partial [Candidatus Aenigmarchaeota archaeon]|nr:hypothetical protein [Candidatus Aenigmarchaeota archaeon]
PAFLSDRLSRVAEATRAMTRRKGASIVILVFSLLAIIGLASFALDLGYVLNQRYELQKAVESAALLAASEYEVYEEDLGAGNLALKVPAAADIENAATGIASVYYQALKDNNQLLNIGTDATPVVTLDASSSAVKVAAGAEIVPFFISMLGIKKIEINAIAAAVSAPVYLSSVYPKPTGSILNGLGLTYRDTEIKDPLGSDTSLGAIPTTTVHNQNNDLNNIYGQPDGNSLSLGPGGYITLKLSTILADGKGVDLAIYERGNADGYFVYAGIDINPNTAYVDASIPGGGIQWINISCTGIPLYTQTDGMIGCHRTSVQINGVAKIEYKFYGSGLFDLGTKCTNPVDGVIYDGTDDTTAPPKLYNVKYLKIIDDNTEDGFFLQPRFNINTPYAVPSIFPGEHSTITPGADIDAVAILHHS